jgi:hypothetical protein
MPPPHAKLVKLCTVSGLAVWCPALVFAQTCTIFITGGANLSPKTGVRERAWATCQEGRAKHGHVWQVLDFIGKYFLRAEVGIQCNP